SAIALEHESPVAGAVDLERSTPSSHRREPCLLLSGCSILPAATARRRRYRSSTPAPAPGNKGQPYAADPPTVDEIIAVMRHARHVPYGHRLNGLIVVLWRAGLRINEALSLTEPIWTTGADRSWSETARTTAAARSGWTH